MYTALRYEFDKEHEKITKNTFRSLGRYLVFRPQLTGNDYAGIDFQGANHDDTTYAPESPKHLHTSVAMFLHTWPIELAGGREHEDPCLSACQCEVSRRRDRIAVGSQCLASQQPVHLGSSR